MSTAVLLLLFRFDPQSVSPENNRAVLFGTLRSGARMTSDFRGTGDIMPSERLLQSLPDVRSTRLAASVGGGQRRVRSSAERGVRWAFAASPPRTVTELRSMEGVVPFNCKKP